jgi:hypothetical protein
MGSFAIRKKQQLLRSANHPRLAIDLAADAIRVIDPNSNALIASAGLAQVTATPETYRFRYGRWWWFPTLEQLAQRLFEQAVTGSLSTTPVLGVRVPGLQH